mmetsp:Transcript_23046/g.53883  ORF Transcript_23046/g.53883 Transcript_23046/m.53883 type:complete len:240 (-) Transcript_23046:95-814(-)
MLEHDCNHKSWCSRLPMFTMDQHRRACLEGGEENLKSWFEECSDVGLRCIIDREVRPRDGGRQISRARVLLYKRHHVSHAQRLQSCDALAVVLPTKVQNTWYDLGRKEVGPRVPKPSLSCFCRVQRLFTHKRVCSMERLKGAREHPDAFGMDACGELIRPVAIKLSATLHNHNVLSRARSPFHRLAVLSLADVHFLKTVLIPKVDNLVTGGIRRHVVDKTGVHSQSRHCNWGFVSTIHS